MPNKLIGDLDLRSSFSDDCNIPSDDGIQTWRNTAVQMAAYMKVKNRQAYVAKSADYTVTDSDDADIIAMTTGGSDRTVTLPAASANANRAIYLKKVDSGAGALIVARAGSDTIDGDTSVSLRNKNDFLYIVSTGAGWLVIDGMNDALATKRGLRRYIHGGSYSGGGAPTVTLSSGGGTLSTVELAEFIPYETVDGVWRMRFNVVVSVSSTSRSALYLAVAGVTFFNSANVYQFISGGAILASANMLGYAAPNPNTGNFGITHNAALTSTVYSFSGDVRLNSKPTWAY